MKTSRKRHILVTGIHRSGTTFVGKMLSSAPGTGYVQEPFNPEYGVTGVDLWYPYIRQGHVSESYYAEIVRNIVSGHAVYRKKSADGDHFFKKTGKRLLGSRDYLQYLASTKMPGSRRLIIKDPLASLSSEWMHKKFDMDVIILLRHPAGFIASTQRLGWNYYFLSDIMTQTQLMEEYLHEILAPFNIASMKQWQKGALLWQCIYSILDVYAERNPSIKIVRLEDISLAPEEMFRELHKHLELPFTKKTAHKIQESTGSNNPVNAPGGKVHHLQRNSRQLSNAWKRSINRNMAIEIRKLAGPVGEKYYGKDW
ncbi:hypothetical protein DRQ21_01665 [Candidatus Fermentibacteria bacterium]|nr:MAG: hypothetical protein DRQ21_01665 [Candidatus Fermentibacteria bacterium]